MRFPWRTVVLVVALSQLWKLAHRVRFLLRDDSTLFPGTLLTSNNCSWYPGPEGMEDVVLLDNGVLLGSEMSIVRLEKTAAAHADPGGDFDADIWAITGIPAMSTSEDAAKPVLTRVPRLNYPAGVRFHPHGLGLLPGSPPLLFVVNHAFAHGGERIDVFEVQLAGNRSDGSSGVPSLLFLHAVVLGDDFANVVNDVAPISADEFYFTQWRPFAHGTLPHFLHELVVPVYFFLNPFGLRLTRIYHCKGAGVASVCRAVGPAGIAWNGIHVVDVETVAVADVFAEDAWAIFDRDHVSGDLALRHRIAGDVSKIDNFAASAGKPGELWGAGVSHLPTTGSVFDAVAALGTPPYRRPAQLQSGSHAVHVTFNGSGSAYATVARYFHDGSLLSGWSVAQPVGRHLVLGSFFDEGALVCKLF